MLKAIGAPATPQNLKFLATWQRWEGGHTKNDAKFNWLNTTHGPGRSINSVGVRRFDSFDRGVKSTAETLMNGKYDDIVAGLTQGNPYKVKPVAGLSTWVSGDPTARPDYAAKVLGGKAAPAPSSPVRVARPPRGSAVGGIPQLSEADETWNWTMDFLNRDRHDQRFLESLKRLPEPSPQFVPSEPSDHEHPDVPTKGPGIHVNGKVMKLGTSWAGTHVTDGLDWNHGAKTARDIMASPGTAVLAPESGEIVRHGSAQGGQSMYFLSDSGAMYWLGHIEGMLPVNTRVKRGQRIAVISADHDAPHLHIDKYRGKGKDKV